MRNFSRQKNVFRRLTQASIYENGNLLSVPFSEGRSRGSSALNKAYLGSNLEIDTNPGEIEGVFYTNTSRDSFRRRRASTAARSLVSTFLSFVPTIKCLFHRMLMLPDAVYCRKNSNRVDALVLRSRNNCEKARIYHIAFGHQPVLRLIFPKNLPQPEAGRGSLLIRLRCDDENRLHPTVAKNINYLDLITIVNCFHNYLFVIGVTTISGALFFERPRFEFDTTFSATTDGTSDGADCTLRFVFGIAPVALLTMFPLCVRSSFA